MSLYLTRSRLEAPIKVGILFSLLTYALFLFGPWKFRFKEDLGLALLVALYNLSMFVGFKIGAASNVTYKARVTAEATRHFVLRLGTFAFAVTAVTLVPRFMIETGYFGGDVSGLISKIQLGMSDAHSVYSEHLLRESVTGVWKLINLICVATGFVSWLYTGIAILTWKQLSVFRKIFTVVFWAVLLVQATAKGQNFGIFDLLAQITVFMVIRQLVIVPGALKSAPGSEGTLKSTSTTPRQAGMSRRPSRGRVVRYAAAAAVAVIVFVSSFANTMSSRVGENYDFSSTDGTGNAVVDFESAAWRLLPQEARPTALTLTYYVAHGYVGLALARDLPFTPTFGFGSSVFVIDNMKEVFGIDLMPRTYHHRLESRNGYSATVKWHTAYLWLANDVSYFGVSAILFFLMLIFGFAWKDFLVNGNLFAVLLMAVYTTFIGFVSANNHAFSESNSLGAYWVLLIVWWLTRRTYDWSGVLHGAT